MLKYSESPLFQLPYLELFQSGRGASQGVFGGASLDTFSREAQIKKMKWILHLVSVKNITFKSSFNWFKIDMKVCILIGLPLMQKRVEKE